VTYGNLCSSQPTLVAFLSFFGLCSSILCGIVQFCDISILVSVDALSDYLAFTLAHPQLAKALKATPAASSVSNADLIALAGAYAVKLCDGPDIEVRACSVCAPV